MRSLLPLVIALYALMGLWCGSCADDKASYVPSIGNGEFTPTMLTTDVRTFVSDSGYTRYFIKSAIWAMYDEAAEPFWKFPDTLWLEQYDRDMKVTASMVCDSAVYFSQKRLWRLDGDVLMVNTQGDSFATPQVFWDQAKREVYSDSFIHIVRSDRIIEGYGFTSNEPMTAYTVNRPTGIFPVARPRSEDTASVEPDTVTSEPASGRRLPSRSRTRQ